MACQTPSKKPRQAAVEFPACTCCQAGCGWWGSCFRTDGQTCKSWKNLAVSKAVDTQRLHCEVLRRRSKTAPSQCCRLCEQRRVFLARTGMCVALSVRPWVVFTGPGQEAPEKVGKIGFSRAYSFGQQQVWVHMLLKPYLCCHLAALPLQACFG